jgi:hypothetical protein
MQLLSRIISYVSFQIGECLIHLQQGHWQGVIQLVQAAHDSNPKALVVTLAACTGAPRPLRT